MICELAEQKKEGEIEAMQCHFCPSVKGIVKRVVFNAAETIWVSIELGLSCILSVTPGIIPSFTRKILAGFISTRSTPAGLRGSFGSISNIRKKHFAKSATIPKD